MEAGTLELLDSLWPSGALLSLSVDILETVQESLDTVPACYLTPPRRSVCLFPHGLVPGQLASLQPSLASIPSPWRYQHQGLVLASPGDITVQKDPHQNWLGGCSECVALTVSFFVNSTQPS